MDSFGRTLLLGRNFKEGFVWKENFVRKWTHHDADLNMHLSYKRWNTKFYIITKSGKKVYFGAASSLAFLK